MSSNLSLIDQCRAYAQDGWAWCQKNVKAWWAMVRWRQVTPPREQRQVVPLFVKVFAAFSTLDEKIIADDIEISLNFLRHDFASESSTAIQAAFQEALDQPQDLSQLAQELKPILSLEEKVLLGVQIYLLISHAEQPTELLGHFHSFMSALGISDQAVALVHQLTSSSAVDMTEATAYATEQPAPLEALRIAPTAPADLVLNHLEKSYSLLVFRLQNLILLKNTSESSIMARGHLLSPGEFTRLYPGQRVVLGEVVLEHQDLIAYLNAKQNLSSTELFLGRDADGRLIAERNATDESLLQLRFGLGVEILALKPNKIRIRETILRPNEQLKVGLHDKLSFDNGTEVTLADLRRRAREMGGRFSLSPTKFDYLVSTNPELLRAGDILLSPSPLGEVLMRIICDYEANAGELEVIRSARPITVRDQPVRERVPLSDGERISLGEGVYLRCQFSERIIEEERNIVSVLEVRDLSHSFSSVDTALENISLTARRGEMICVLGPSGCGKSTFLRTIAGHLKPQKGSILLNGSSLYDNLDGLRPFVSYVPHDEAYDPLLTVRENLVVAAAIRCPQLGRVDRQRRIEAKLTELGLDAVANRRSGTPEDKTLSSGERKRLNVGLEMISLSDIFLFDEPTSGLSSKDSEHVLEILRGLAHNKIVFVSIHQPSSRLFHFFHKALLLDRGGRVAFYGTPDEMLHYFYQAAEVEKVRLEQSADEPTEKLSPEIIFDVLESPLRDLAGEPIMTTDERGRLLPARRFTPGFWRDRFQTHLILRNTRRRTTRVPVTPDSAVAIATPLNPPQMGVRHRSDKWTHLWALLKRSFLSKLRHRTNLAITLLEAPALALLISIALRYSEESPYTFASAYHIPTYLFLAHVVAIFLGLTNSADDIVRERSLILRESNHSFRPLFYVVSKALALSFFALIQCSVFLLIGNYILELREMFVVHLFWTFLSALTGIALGLLVSALAPSVKAAQNFIPIVLIPQIILGGALVKYEDMNRDLSFAYNIQRRSQNQNPSRTSEKFETNLEVPFFCQFMPLRWTYEACLIAQATKNPLTQAQRKIQKEINDIIEKSPKPPTPLEASVAARLDLIKEQLSQVSALKGNDHKAMAEVLRNCPLQQPLPEKIEKNHEDPERTSAQFFVNEKVWDLFNKAENQRLSDKTSKKPPNVFFGAKKSLWGLSFPTLWLNFLALILITALVGSALVWVIHRKTKANF